MGSPAVLSSLGYNSGTLAQISYSADPVTFLSGIGDPAILDTALSKVLNLDVLTLATTLNIDLSTAYTMEWQSPLLNQQVSLGNHHIYGSSRIGIKNYFPSQYRNTWDYETGLIDTTKLGLKTPWYSYAYNDVIDTGKTEPYGNGLVHQAVAQHLLGQKQYELTNHLGNVQASLSDKRYVKTTGVGVRDYFNASIQSAYDYYPFGMLMPGRFISDTTPTCVTDADEYYLANVALCICGKYGYTWFWLISRK